MGKKIFVLGNSRSGTTMLARMLDKHDLITDLNELHYIEELVTGEEFNSELTLSSEKALKLGAKLISRIEDGYFHSTLDSKYIELAAKILGVNDGNSSVTSSKVYELITETYANQRSCEFTIDQTPRNVFYVPEILQQMPTAKIIALIRDPRDICLSQKGKWRRRFLGAKIPMTESFRAWANYNPIITAKIWKSAARAITTSANDFNVMVVKYEDLVKEPENRLREICKYLNVTYDPSMIAIEKVGSSVQKDKLGSRGVDKSRVEAWRSGGLLKSEIEICESITNAELISFDYELSQIKGSRIVKLYFYLVIPFKMSLSLILNLKKVSSLFQWLKKRGS